MPFIWQAMKRRIIPVSWLYTKVAKDTKSYIKRGKVSASVIKKFLDIIQQLFIKIFLSSFHLRQVSHVFKENVLCVNFSFCLELIMLFDFSVWKRKFSGVWLMNAPKWFWLLKHCPCNGEMDVTVLHCYMTSIVLSANPFLSWQISLGNWAPAKFRIEIFSFYLVSSQIYKANLLANFNFDFGKEIV